MKNQVLATMLLFSVMLAACSKKKDATTDPKPQIKLLTKIGKVATGSTDTVFTYISYDNKNRISEMKTGNSIKAYNYTGDDLTSVTNKDANGNTTSTVLTFTYSNGVISGGHAPNSIPALDYTYTYNISNGKVIKRNGPPQYTHEFTYTGNNIASWKLIGSGTATYDYGPDKSPFYNARYRYYLMLPGESEDIYSENNLITYTQQSTPVFRGSRYSYLIGNDGFPKSATVRTTTFLDPDIYTSTSVTYYYSMIDVTN